MKYLIYLNDPLMRENKVNPKTGKVERYKQIALISDSDVMEPFDGYVQFDSFILSKYWG